MKKNFQAHKEMKLSVYRSVLQALQDGCSTRREIQRASNLSWGGTSTVVNQMLANGLITETMQNKGTAGRPSNYLQAVGDRNLVAAVELRRDHSIAVIMSLDFTIVHRLSLDYENNPSNQDMETRLDQIWTQLLALVLENSIRRLHLVLTGAVDEKRRIWHKAPSMPEIHDFTAEFFTAKHPDIELEFEHDITAWARSVELQLPDKLKNLGGYAFLNLSRGIGLAINENGRFLRGARGMSCEIGHLPMPSDLNSSSLQNGGLETAFTPEALFAGAGIKKKPVAFEEYCNDLSAKDLEKLKACLKERLFNLLLYTVTLYDPPLLVIGGEIVEPFRDDFQDWEAFIAEHGWNSPHVPLYFYRAEPGTAASGSARVGVQKLSDEVIKSLS